MYVLGLSVFILRKTHYTGTAGGLTNLAKMPACNALVVGAVKKTLSGFSQANVLPHTGYIYYTDLVQSVPPVIPSVTTVVWMFECRTLLCGKKLMCQAETFNFCYT